MDSVPIWLQIASGAFGAAAVLGAPTLIVLLITQYTRPPSGHWRATLRALLAGVSLTPILWACTAFLLIFGTRLAYGDWPHVVDTPWSPANPYDNPVPIDASSLPFAQGALLFLLPAAGYSIYFFWPLWVVARRGMARPGAWALGYMLSWVGMITWTVFDPGGALHWCYS